MDAGPSGRYTNYPVGPCNPPRNACGTLQAMLLLLLRLQSRLATESSVRCTRRSGCDYYFANGTVDRKSFVRPESNWPWRISGSRCSLHTVLSPFKETLRKKLLWVHAVIDGRKTTGRVS